MKLELLDKVSETSNIKSFIFKPNKKLVWRSGQYIYFNLDNNIRQFTISSSPTEKVIQITTNINKHSDFKTKLDNLKIGSKINVRGPFGNYTYTPKFGRHVYIAGGIGITPFRAMIKYSVDKNLRNQVILIYSNSNPKFVYKNELDKWQKENTFFKINYHNSSELGRLNKKHLEYLLTNDDINNAHFWSSGSNEFVNNIEDILEELNIESDKIRTEKFTRLLE